MRRLLTLLALAVALAGCGTEESAPPRTLPRAALPDLPSQTRALDADALAADALQPGALERLLDQAGYVTGTEREFAGKTRTFDHVVARTLVFGTPGGAESYLGWLRGHGADFLGRAQAADVSVPGTSAVTFALAQCGSCKKEVPTFLAGWRRGEHVVTLLAGGSGANPERFAALARELDQTVG